MKLKSEEQILDAGFRKKVIDEIVGSENVARKDLELKKYEVYKDQTKKWVINGLINELDQDTVYQMVNRASNISIAKKIIDKLARTYNNGVIRTVEDATSQEAIEELTKLMDFNSAMKKVDRYLVNHRNTQAFVCPKVIKEESEEDSKKYALHIKVIPPFMYDVIEDYDNPEEQRVVILTDFVERNQNGNNYAPPGESGKARGNQYYGRGDGINQIIADNQEDRGVTHRTFIWWSENFHFTTDDKGQILKELSPEELANPIGTLPFVNFAEDQDGHFWARGGNDLVDGAILINTLLTDMYGIANVQGWGQLVVTGKGIPNKIITGPHKAIVINQEDGDPTPSVQYVSSNPPLDTHMRMIEQETALLLSTNNLSPSNVAGKLDAQNFPSGIAMVIEQSESTADVEDRQQVYKDKEPILWEIVRRWMDVFADSQSLSEEFAEIGTFTDSNVQLEFINPKMVISEKEKLEEIKLKKELGLITQLDAIKMVNPSLSDDEAQAKLDEILKDRIVKQQLILDSAVTIGDQNGQANEAQGQEETSQEVVDGGELAPQAGSSSLGGEDATQNIQKLALNGAQVTALVDVVTKVAAGLLPRESAIQIISAAFQMDEATASAILGNVGAGFKPMGNPLSDPAKLVQQQSNQPQETKEDKDEDDDEEKE